MGLAIKCDKCGVFDNSPVWVVMAAKVKTVEAEIVDDVKFLDNVEFLGVKKHYFCEKCGDKVFGKLAPKEQYVIQMKI